MAHLGMALPLVLLFAALFGLVRTKSDEIRKVEEEIQKNLIAYDTNMEHLRQKHENFARLLKQQSELIEDLKSRFVVMKNKNESCERTEPVSYRLQDCEDLEIYGIKKSGVYTVLGRYLKGPAMNVFCDVDKDGNAWTVIQRRNRLLEKQENFERNWADYENGFGDVRKDFWIGNEELSDLTYYGSHLHIKIIGSNGLKDYVEYKYFEGGPQYDNYRLTVEGFSPGNGMLKDFMSQFNGKEFKTKDRVEDKDGCEVKEVGWWHVDGCGNEGVLNGDFSSMEVEGYYTKDAKPTWFDVIFVEMKVRQANLLDRP